MSEQNKTVQSGSAAKTQRTMPDPMTNPETERFYEATAAGKLLVGHCKACGKHHYYPRAICPHCLSDQTEWVQAGGGGSIYSYSVLRRGVPVALPGTPLAFLATPLFSPAAKLALLREPFVRRGDASHEESIADFVRRRLGTEFLDYAIDPFVAGIFAGDPEQISVPAAFPKLHALEQRWGSLIRGQVLGGAERRRHKEAAKNSARRPRPTPWPR